ncbi:MAG: hypothetical protein ABW328_21685 [Ilumatobacteraceae bacterium]
MSASTPADLATTFRSLDRRRREAIGDADPAIVGVLSGDLQRHVDAAASAVGSAADAESVAAAIAARPADSWDEPTLDELRRLALDVGAVLRRIAATVEAAQG